MTVDAALLDKLHDTAAALARAVDRANVRVKAGCRDAGAARMVRRCVDLQRTFETLARTLPPGDPAYQAVTRADEIYRLVVRRVVTSAGLAPAQRRPADGPVKGALAGRAPFRRSRGAPAHVGRDAQGRPPGAYRPGPRRGRRPGAACVRSPGSRGTETTRNPAAAHGELIAMAGQAVRESRLRRDAIESAARDLREAARRTAALVEETARILETMSATLYRAG